MMSAITVAAAETICSIYAESQTLAARAIEKSIEIGRLLQEAKAQLKHGEWIPWIESSLPFNRNQAQKYMQIYNSREFLNDHSNGHLDTSVDGACKLIAEQNKGEKRAESNIIQLDHGCEVSDLESLDRKFGTIYADPPWLYGNQGTRAATGNHYGGMTVDEICEMPIEDLAADTAHLHLWTTNGFLPDSFRVMEAWGFEYKSCFVWVKPQMGIGNYWRVSHEFMLLGTRGSCVFTNKALKSWASISRNRHSSKPDEIRHMIESASPGPFLELFARRTAPGWVSWGNEIEKSLFYGGADNA